MSAWMEAKGESLLKRQVDDVLATTQCPEPGFTEGMVEALYAVGLLNNDARGFWLQRIAVAVSARRTELGAERISWILAEGPQKVRRTA